MNIDSENSNHQLKIIRRALYAIIVLSVAVISIPMVLAAIVAINNGTAIDPFTGNRFEASEKNRASCIIKGGELLNKSIHHEISLADYNTALFDLKWCINLYPNMYRELEKQKPT